MYTSGLLNCARKIAAPDSFRSSGNLFGPYFFSRSSACLVVRPFGCDESWAKTFLMGNACQRIVCCAIQKSYLLLQVYQKYKKPAYLQVFVVQNLQQLKNSKPMFDIFRPTVLVFEVVGMLPNIQTNYRRVAFKQRRVLISSRIDD